MRPLLSLAVEGAVRGDGPPPAARPLPLAAIRCRQLPAAPGANCREKESQWEAELAKELEFHRQSMLSSGIFPSGISGRPRASAAPISPLWASAARTLQQEGDQTSTARPNLRPPS